MANTGELLTNGKQASTCDQAAETEESRMRAELAKERDFIAAVLEASGAMVMIFDTEGRVVRCNRACEQVTGYSSHELTGKVFWDVFIGDSRKAISRGRLEALVTTKAPSAFESEWMTKSGQRRRISFSNTVLIGEEGRVEYVVATGIDITARYQAEMELLKSETQFRSIWQTARAPMCLTDRSGTVLKVNSAFTRMVSKSAEELCGTDVKALFSPEDQPVIGQYHATQFATGITEPGFERELHFASGRCGVFDVAMTRIDLPNEAPQLLTIYREITEYKRVADELARAKEAAECANRDLVEANRYLEETGRLAQEMAERAEGLSAAKGEFLANMTHEIRTPLNGILGMTDLALQSDLNPDQREYLELVRSSAEALLFLVNDVLDYSKYEAGKLALNRVELSLRAMLREVLKPLGLRASLHSLQFEYVVADDVPDHLIGDPQRLSQILMNLVSNAIKFTHQGKVSISVQRKSISNSKVVLVFSIKDTGIGIAKEKHKSIFEPFTQADGSTTRKYGGTGLGLSIASGLVKMMDGVIWVESELGQGATFHFTASMELASVAANNGYVTSHLEAGEPRKRNMRILLAEDNVVNQRLATHVLQREGHEVALAKSGREALALLEKGEFDLVLMDVQMPDLDGLEATARIRELERESGQRLPIVAMTAQAGDSDRDRCLEAGMDAYLTKPVRISELMRMIESVVPGGLIMDSKKTPQESLVEEQFSKLDQALALSRVGGDMDLLREVVGLFLDDYPKAIEKIRQAIAANDASAVEHNAHSLKGSVSTFGANDVFESALALEKQGRGGDLAGAPVRLARLEEALLALRPELEALQSN